MMPHPTPDDDLNALLAAFTSALQPALADTLLGIYLQGSWAMRDADPHSDVDFAVVTRHDLSDVQVAALRDVHARLHDHPSRWATRLEGSYFPQDVLRAAPQPGGLLWYNDNGSRVLERSDHCNTWVVRATLHTYGLPLSGPPAATLLDAVPPPTLRREMFATMRDWGAQILAAPERYHNAFYQCFIAASYARMLHDIARGTPGTKRAAVAWAAQHLDARWHTLVAHAHAARTDPAVAARTLPDSAAFAETLVFVRAATAHGTAMMRELGLG